MASSAWASPAGLPPIRSPGRLLLVAELHSVGRAIEAEDPRKPLSDSKIMKILNDEGINIARRTVAKYRDELNIPSSTDRKQIF